MFKTFGLVFILILQFHCKPQTSSKDETALSLTDNPSMSSEPVEAHEELVHLISTDPTGLRVWNWNRLTIPAYTWPDGTPFGNGLFIDTAFDPQGITIVENQIRFYINPFTPKTPKDAHSPYNYRSEIHTDPWPIHHPLGTEQWIGWKYTFGKNYVIDTSSPITIFQNHPGVNGLSPQLELEIAAFNDPPPASGGEIQVVNAAAGDRIIYPVKPNPGDTLEVVIHVIYGLEDQGLFQVWLNGVLFYDKITSTVYQDQPWGGNNKWGIYHHTFNNSKEYVASSVNIGAGVFDLFMGPLKLLTRTPDHPEYGVNAYDMVKPE